MQILISIMIDSFKFIFKYFIFWLITIAFFRCLFLLYFIVEILHNNTSLDALKSFAFALPLDLSMVSYICILPSILFTIYRATNIKYCYSAIKIYTYILLILASIFSLADILVYKEMGVKIHFKLLSHILHPSELFLTVSAFTFFISVSICVAIIAALIYIFSKQLLNKNSVNIAFKKLSNRDAILSIVINLFVLAIFAVFCRGGLQPIPINESEVYFSKSNLINNATANAPWVLIHSYIENNKALNTNPYIFMENNKAEQIVKALYTTDSTLTKKIFTQDRPNIVLLILESFSADVLLDEEPWTKITPNLRKLKSNGIYFNNIFATGHVSDQGIPGILSGYPAQPITSIIGQPDKYPKIPCINKSLKPLGYTSSFYFGGQLIYGNIKSYLYHNQFDIIKEQKDFDAHKSGRLGIHDEYMLNFWQLDLNKMKPPFFSCLFTLSSHATFDEPYPTNVDWGGSQQNYLNAIQYTDKAIGDFFNKIKQYEWYKNTVFVIVADHSHDTPKEWHPFSKEHYKIPLFIIGDPIVNALKGTIDSTLASQTDIAATILHQLNLESNEFLWSKNIYSNKNHFAFYTFNNGFGYVSNTGFQVWNSQQPNNFLFYECKDSLKKNDFDLEGKAYLQTLFNQYLSY